MPHATSRVELEHVVRDNVTAAEAAIAEYERDGGAVAAEEFFATRAAETRERYGSGRE